ncbi:MAG: type 2 isopentenyl-diphosphate Delta-isomerase [Anaerolineaceae bacterium]|nr:type 2 isopentenyl-diphosphate Delta-isomerase [Anaerolineaceae bacterium]
MKKDTQISSRKYEHIRINLEKDVQSGLSSGLENYLFIHQALPEMKLEDVDLSQSLFGKKQPVPVMVSSMTGGTEEAARLNRTLAEAAQEVGLAMGIGSQRAAIKDPELVSTFQVRQFAPDILLFANLGAVQLNYGYGIDECQKAVEMIEADALILHLNPLQEALQPEGDTHFGNLAEKIAQLRQKITVPLIIKEVGWGISEQTARLLIEAGVDAIDVAGAGGTSWSQVEMYRIKDPYKAQTAGAFSDWGIPTAQSILNVRKVDSKLPVFASGGLRNGIDIAKCLALGACMGGMAGTFLKAANDSLETTVATMQVMVDQVRIAMFASGAADLKSLTQDKLSPVEGKH